MPGPVAYLTSEKDTVAFVLQVLLFRQEGQRTGRFYLHEGGERSLGRFRVGCSRAFGKDCFIIEKFRKCVILGIVVVGHKLKLKLTLLKYFSLFTCQIAGDRAE